MPYLAFLVVLAGMAVGAYFGLRYLPQSWQDELTEFRLRLWAQVTAWVAVVGPDLLAFITWLMSQDVSWLGGWAPRIVQMLGALSLLLHYFVEKKDDGLDH